MNIYLQIGIGLLPGIITVVFLMFKRKAFQFKKIVFSLALLAACGGMIFAGVREAVSSGAFARRLSREKMFAFANLFALEGAYDEAYEVLEQYSIRYGYDDECRLLTARLKLLEGDYESADGLYRYLVSNSGRGLLAGDGDAIEVQFAAAKAGSGASDLVMMQYLQSIGADMEAYGYSDAAYSSCMSLMQMDAGDIKWEISHAIKDAYSDIAGEDIEDCVEAVCSVSRAYQSLAGDEGDGSIKYRRAFAAIDKDNPEFLTLDCVKKARIKAYVMAGDYDAITEKLNLNSSYHELMIAAEIYMGGMVRKSDFAQNYQLLADRDADSIRDQVNKIYDRVRDDLSKIERKNLKARISAVSSQLSDLVLVTIKERLAVLAEEEAGTDRTKVCLQLAKIENYFGNETATDNYLREAIYSSQDCGDDSYASAMAKIIKVINNDGDGELENIKNVSEYVQAVLDHSLTVDVEKILSSERQARTDGLVEVAETGADADFVQAAVNFVSRAMSAITIGRIDVSNFPSVLSRVQISSDYLNGAKELRKEVRIYDCDAEITDFTLKKINYTGSNIILVCDVSGSMMGSIQDLKDAVVTFISDKNEKENISIVTFNHSIVGTAAFGSSDESLTAFAESMSASGGTDIFSTVVNCLGSFPSEESANNVLILMTDGQDGNWKDVRTINEEIGALAQEKDVTIYTVGLSADVDTAYLNSIANSGDGEFVYVSDSACLTSFYDMLHQQVNSQYELTYDALDTMTMSGRTLEVTLPSEQTRDVKKYSVGPEEDDGSGLKVTQGLSIAGMSPRYLYRGLQDVEVKLKGTGFQKDDTIAVRLNGNIDYTIKAEFVDSETYKLVIPASIAVGTYDVEAAIGQKKKILQNGFSVIVQGGEKKTEFGPYVFTSAEKVENRDGSYTLSGAVTLNGWLHFKGDVSIAGDIENGGSIDVTDPSGSYVEFDPATAEGVGSFLAEKGVSLDIPALQRFKLYNDPQNLYDYSKYMVQEISTRSLAIHQLMRLDSPKIKLYPNSIGLYYSTGTTILPYQDQILQAAGMDDLFQFKFDGSAQVTDRNVGIVMDISYKDPSSSEYGHQINLLNAPVYFNGSFAVKIDTLKNEYTLGAMVRLAFFAEQSGLGAEVSWKGHLIPDSVKLQLELAKAVKLRTAIPIEVNNFSFMVSDINNAIEKGSFASLKFIGSASFSSMKVKEYVPAIGKIVGDLSLLEMPDTTASIRVLPFQLEADATLMFLSEIKLAEASVRLGSFEYTNSLLQLDSADVAGLRAALKAGIMWESADGRVNLELSGTGEIDAHSRFVGIDMAGTAAYDIGWWIIRSKNKVTGEFAMGLYTTYEGRHQFVFTYRTQSGDGKVKGKFYYIDENGKCGKNNGTLS